MPESLPGCANSKAVAISLKGGGHCRILYHFELGTLRPSAGIYKQYALRAKIALMRTLKSMVRAVFALTVLCSAAIVSPLSTASIESMESAHQEFTRLRNFEGAMAPSELEKWWSDVDVWLGRYIDQLNSIDLNKLERGTDKVLSVFATEQKTWLERAVDEKQWVTSVKSNASQVKLDQMLGTVHRVLKIRQSFEFMIVPDGMNTTAILFMLSDGEILCMKGLTHCRSVLAYYESAYGAPRW